MFCPATVKTPVRGVIPGFCATAYPTGAIPVPDEPCVKVSQGALLVPCQVQPLELATKVNNPVPPAPSAESVVVVGEMPNAHGAVPSPMRIRNAWLEVAGTGTVCATFNTGKRRIAEPRSHTYPPSPTADTPSLRA